MKSRKILPAFLIVILIFSLFGCKVKESDNEILSERAQTTKSNTVKVTFPEGYTAAQIAKRLEENEVCSFDDFIAQCNNTEYLDEYGFEIENPENRAFLLEGYLFPDTYEFYRGENPKSAIKRFLNNTKAKLTDEIMEKVASSGFSLDEILTLASMIQWETYYESELKNVSSVLINRLSSSSFPKLQCDCSIFYLERNVKAYVSEERYEELSLLYNTYKCTGLPEGPIANSSIEAIKAALDPADTSYYFFVTDSDNNYYFASTWQEHQENCKKCGY